MQSSKQTSLDLMEQAGKQRVYSIWLLPPLSPPPPPSHRSGGAAVVIFTFISICARWQKMDFAMTKNVKFHF